MDIDSIMVVDDSEIVQIVTEDLIHRYDPEINILKAYDGQEAIDKLMAMPIPPSVILLDINMPRMNGFEFLEEYKKTGKRGNIVAMHTSSADEKDRKRAQEYDFVKFYLVKPLEIDDLDNLRNLHKDV